MSKETKSKIIVCGWGILFSLIFWPSLMMAAMWGHIVTVIWMCSISLVLNVVLFAYAISKRLAIDRRWEPAIQAMRLALEETAEEMKKQAYRRRAIRADEHYKMQHDERMADAEKGMGVIVATEEHYWEQVYENDTPMETDKQKILSDMIREKCPNSFAPKKEMPEQDYQRRKNRADEHYVMKELQEQIDAVRLIAKNNNKFGMILSKEQIARMKGRIESRYASKKKQMSKETEDERFYEWLENWSD